VHGNNQAVRPEPVEGSPHYGILLEELVET
jgi:hypothetical protein